MITDEVGRRVVLLHERDCECRLAEGADHGIATMDNDCASALGQYLEVARSLWLKAHVAHAKERA